MLCENQTPQQWNTPKNKRQKLHNDNVKTSSLSTDQIPTMESLLTFDQMLLGFPNTLGYLTNETQMEHEWTQEFVLVTGEDLHAKKGTQKNLQRPLLEAEGCPWLLLVVTNALIMTNPAIKHKGEFFLKPPQQICIVLIISRISSPAVKWFYYNYH